MHPPDIRFCERDAEAYFFINIFLVKFQAIVGEW